MAPKDTDPRKPGAQRAALRDRLAREIRLRRRAEADLKESQDRLRFLAQTTGDALYQLRYDSMSYDYISPGIEALTGYTPEEINRVSFASLVRKIEPQGRGRTSRGRILEKRLGRGDQRAQGRLSDRDQVGRAPLGGRPLLSLEGRQGQDHRLGGDPHRGGRKAGADRTSPPDPGGVEEPVLSGRL